MWSSNVLIVMWISSLRSYSRLNFLGLNPTSVIHKDLTSGKVCCRCPLSLYPDLLLTVFLYSIKSRFWMHSPNGTLTYFQSSTSTWKWVAILLNVKEKSQYQVIECILKAPRLSPLLKKTCHAFLKPGLITLLIWPMKFTFWGFSMASAYAAPKWPGDYGKEKGLFYHTGLFNLDRLLFWMYNST